MPEITASVVSQFTPPYKLHIGCGTIRLKGWINIDLISSPGVTDLACDVTQKLPFPDNSCQLIYHEHFLEHLPIEQGVAFLKECHRVLQEGGVMRIAMPSLDVLIEKTYLGTWQELLKGVEFVKSRAELLNICFYWWGHQWLYDREELHRRLKEAGFKIIKDVEWGVSQVPELNQLETREASFLVCEAYKEVSLNDADKLAAQVRQLQSQIAKTKQELKSTRKELVKAQETVRAMESSKFWRLRSLWFRVKEKLGINPTH